MKNNYVYLLLFLVTFFTSKIYGQGIVSKDSLEMNINKAFVSLEISDSLFFEPMIKKEFIQDYLKYFENISPEQFNDKNAARGLILYYSKPNGIKELILEYNETMDEDFKEIFSIGMMTYMKVYFNSDNPGAMMMPNSLNKYALLLPKIEPKDEDVELYLNSEYICLVREAKNGIRVHSEKEYLIEFKLDNKVKCSNQHVFIKKERKVIKCEKKD